MPPGELPLAFNIQSAYLASPNDVAEHSMAQRPDSGNFCGSFSANKRDCDPNGRQGENDDALV
jgi:hypothetical protein